MPYVALERSGEHSEIVDDCTLEEDPQRFEILPQAFGCCP